LKFERGDSGGKKPKPGYVCRACGSELHLIEDCPTQHTRGSRAPMERGPPKPITPDECWFCLSNANVAKHLIVSIGDECYLSLPKGQLIPTGPGSNPLVPGGGHVLIIPVDHHPHPMRSAAAQESSPDVLEEAERYKTALSKMYAQHNASTVIFEVAVLREKGGHAHMQVVPLPNSLSADEIERAFRRDGSRQNVEFEAEDKVEEAMEAIRKGPQGYFRAELPDGRVLLHLIHSPGFNLQFGRQVLANLLGTPQRSNWKDCVMDEEDEGEDATAFKQAFAAFNPVS